MSRRSLNRVAEVAALGALGLVAALLTPPAHAVQLYSNGGLNPQPMSKSGVAAPVGYSWSELQNNTGDMSVANGSLGIAAETGVRHLADDFSVPAGQVWTVDSIDFYAYQGRAPATGSPFTEYNVQLWNGRPGDAGATVIAGDLTTNRFCASVEANLYRIFNSVVLQPNGVAAPAPTTMRKIWRNSVAFSPAVKLPAGTYWIEWQSKPTLAGLSGHPAVTVEGLRNAAGWNARVLDVSTGDWSDATDPGNQLVVARVPMDFPFALHQAVCGDGTQACSEQCDDGNTTSGDGCDANCTPTACGNGVKAGPEQCDDGNTSDGDGCDSDCTLTACGNGILTAGEVCDDHNTVSGDGCDSNCTLPACGNGVKAGPEECDDGNTTSGDGCSASCILEPAPDLGMAGSDGGTTGLLSGGGLSGCSTTTPAGGSSGPLGLLAFLVMFGLLRRRQAGERPLGPTKVRC